jgi:hypothetical protein
MARDAGQVRGYGQFSPPAMNIGSANRGCLDFDEQRARFQVIGDPDLFEFQRLLEFTKDGGFRRPDTAHSPPAAVRRCFH